MTRLFQRLERLLENRPLRPTPFKLVQGKLYIQVWLDWGGGSLAGKIKLKESTTPQGCGAGEGQSAGSPISIFTPQLKLVRVLNHTFITTSSCSDALLCGLCFPSGKSSEVREVLIKYAHIDNIIPTWKKLLMFWYDHFDYNFCEQIFHFPPLNYLKGQPYSMNW